MHKQLLETIFLLIYLINYSMVQFKTIFYKKLSFFLKKKQVVLYYIKLNMLFHCRQWKITLLQLYFTIFEIVCVRCKTIF